MYIVLNVLNVLEKYILQGDEKLDPIASKGQSVSGFVKGTYTRPVFYSKPKSEVKFAIHSSL